MSHASVALLAALIYLCACVPTVYRGYTPYEGRVVDSESGKPIAGVRVVACLLDRYPGAHMDSCKSAGWTKETLTSSDGGFQIDGSRHIGVFVPIATDMFPGPYDTNLRFEAKGYLARELHWWRDRALIQRKPLVVELEAEPGAPLDTHKDACQ